MMRFLAIPLVLILSTIVPATGTTQAPDSLLGTELSHAVIPGWRPNVVRYFCLTWVAEREDRPTVLVIVDAAPADTTRDPICPRPQGGLYPVWLDVPICPTGDLQPLGDRAFIILRCADDAIRFYRRKGPPSSKAGQ